MIDFTTLQQLESSYNLESLQESNESLVRENRILKILIGFLIAFGVYFLIKKYRIQQKVNRKEK